MYMETSLSSFPVASFLISKLSFRKIKLKNFIIQIWEIVLLYYLFIYLWLCWVFVAVNGLLIVVASPFAEHGL